MLLDPDWQPRQLTPEEHKERDPLAIFDAAECPTCKALIKDGICLNACHLSAAAQSRFHQFMRGPVV